MYIVGAAASSSSVISPGLPFCNSEPAPRKIAIPSGMATSRVLLLLTVVGGINQTGARCPTAPDSSGGVPGFTLVGLDFEFRQTEEGSAVRFMSAPPGGATTG